MRMAGRINIPSRQCGIEDCPKGGTHKESYLATACRLYSINHRIVILPDGSVRTVPRNGSVANAFGGQAQAREAAVEVVAAEPSAGTMKELKAAAKALKVRCFNLMNRVELKEAVNCIKEGRIDRLRQLEQQGRERFRGAFARGRLQ